MIRNVLGLVVAVVRWEFHLARQRRAERRDADMTHEEFRRAEVTAVPAACPGCQHLTHSTYGDSITYTR